MIMTDLDVSNIFDDAIALLKGVYEIETVPIKNL